MVKKNLITQVRAAAARHPDDKAVQKLIEKLNLSQQVVVNNAHIATGSALEHYQLGTEEAEGFKLLLDPPVNMVTAMCAQAFYLHEVAVITDCLVSLLGSLYDEPF